LSLHNQFEEEEMRIDGLDELLKALGHFATPDATAETVKPALAATAEEIRSYLARYPRKPSYPLRWASMRQKFYVLYVLRKGMGPYRRSTDPGSQRLQASWAVEQNERWRVIVGTRVTYAPYVQGKEKQQPFHADTGWVTDEAAVQRTVASGVLGDNIMAAVQKAFASAR
jgi:hypothetical protein